MNDIFATNRMLGTSGYINRVGRAYFPDPWCDYASLEMPRNLQTVLQWCERIWLTNGTFRMACERTIRYFLTNLEISEVSDQEAQKWKEFLEDQMNIIVEMATIGDDYMCYGNAFNSLYVPFDRYLICPRCHLERPIQKVEFEFTPKFTFVGVCPKCKCKVTFKRRDRRSPADTPFQVLRWSPHHMVIQYNPLSHDVEYRYRMPEMLKNEVRRGNKFYLRTTPWEFIETIKENKLFRFNRDMFFHFREKTLAGLRVMGWGIPRLVSNFKQAYYIQVLKRYNEALGLDYIVPFRVITPAAGNSREADPLLHQHMGMLKRHVLDMVENRRHDPAAWNFLPFPIQYQSMGAEGMTMAPQEMINGSIDEMLNAQGVPVDFYKGTLSLQAAPTALRLFQQTWPQLWSGFNNWLTWLVKQIASIKNWDVPRIRLQKVTMADDLEKKQILLSLAAGNQVSKQTAYAPLGIDIKEEIRRIYDEQRDAAELERQAQKEMQEQQAMDERLAAASQPPPAAGAMPAPAGGAPMMGAPGMGGGGQQQVTPQDMMAQAEQMAYQLLQMPYEQRKSQMLQLKHSNETLHALVKSKMESIRQQAQSIGGYQMLQGGMAG